LISNKFTPLICGGIVHGGCPIFKPFLKLIALGAFEIVGHRVSVRPLLQSRTAAIGSGLLVRRHEPANA